MRIGIDCRLWNESGVGRYIRNLVNQLQQIDNKNEYVLFALSKDREEVVLQNQNFKIAEANVHWHSLEEQIRLPLILRKEKLDLMHFPYFSVPTFYRGKFVITIHDLILHHFPTGKASTHSRLVYLLKLAAYKFVLKKAVKDAKKIITVTEATKNDIENTLQINSEKIAVTYEGVDENLKKSKHTRNNLGDYFLYIGNAYPHKNLDKLIEAFRKVHLDNNNLKLVLVGKEDFFYEKLRNYISKIKLEESVIFYGFARDEELSNLFLHAKALIAPSLIEGFGLSPIEAMDLGCPIIVSDIPVFHETCGSAALYFDPNDSSDIALKMEDILKNKTEVKKRLEEGFKKSKNFSWEKMAKQTLAIYTAALG